MLVAYHNLNLYNELFIDGANLYSIENSKLIKEFNGSEFVAKPHDIRDVLSGKENLLNLKSDDVVVSNAGPYAFAYHYLREKKGLNFRIVRDVQTSFWQGYFLQEKLCMDSTREGDAVLFLSEFQRQLFITLFPESLNEENTFVCAPFMHFFPEELPESKNDYDGLTLGWVGRVTAEKGFHKALEAFVRIRENLGNVRMIIAGGRAQPGFEEYISKILKKNNIPQEEFIRLHNGKFMPHDSVWNAYKQFDIFLFPSVSPNESLGRVIVEATYCEIPVIAANYAAAPEILNKENLLPVTYQKKFLQLGFIGGIGHVESGDIIKKVMEHQKLVNGDIDFYKDHDLKYVNILKGVQKKDKHISLDKNVKKLIEGVRLYQDKPLFSKQKSFEMLSKFLINENYANLSVWNHYILAYMGYNPYLLLFADEERSIFEKLRIEYQKFVMHAKNPIKSPFKKYYFFRRKRFLKNKGY